MKTTKEEHAKLMANLELAKETAIKEERLDCRRELENIKHKIQIQNEKERTKRTLLEEEHQQRTELNQKQQAQIMEAEKSLSEMKERRDQLEEQVLTLRNELQRELDKNGKLTRQVKEIQFEKEEITLKAERVKF